MDRFFVCLLSPSSLFFSLPCFSLVVDSVILLFRLGATPPPRSLRASIMRIPLACCLLSSFFFVALLMLTYLFFFLLFLPIFDFDLDIVCFHPVFFLWVLCCLLGFGYCCDSFRILYDVNTSYVCILIRTYADLTFYFCLRYTICFSCCVYYLLFFIYLLVFLRR